MSRNKMDIKCMKGTDEYAVGYIKRVNKSVGEHMINTHMWERITDQSQATLNNQENKAW